MSEEATAGDLGREMDETRSGMMDKASALEAAVVRTAQDATASVAGLVHGVQDAVAASSDSIRSPAQSSSDTVRDAAAGGMSSVEHALDVRGHVRRHPVPAPAGVFALGFVVGRLARR